MPVAAALIREGSSTSLTLILSDLEVDGLDVSVNTIGTLKRLVARLTKSTNISILGVPGIRLGMFEDDRDGGHSSPIREDCC